MSAADVARENRELHQLRIQKHYLLAVVDEYANVLGAIKALIGMHPDVEPDDVVDEIRHRLVGGAS